MSFKNFLDKSNPKPHKIWVDKCSEFYNRFLQNNDIEMYLTCNEMKSVIAIRFIITLKKIKFINT